MKTFRSFQISVLPSPSSNDHQVRFIADGEDLITQLWPGMIGLDPDDVLVPPSPLVPVDEERFVPIARCDCGAVGCDDRLVGIALAHGYVEWRWEDSEDEHLFRFRESDYTAEVARALADTSWQTPERRASRIVAEMVDRAMLTEHGLNFSWASGRIEDGRLTISLMLEPGPYQVLVHVPWGDESAEAAAERAVAELKRQPASWSAVEWISQAPDLGPPAIAGPGWQGG